MLRVVGAIVALVLTIGGAIALSVYVGGAETRAQNGAKIQQVYVVSNELIPRGTRAEDLLANIKVAEIPAIAVQSGVVTDINSLAGKVTSVDLLPGEQLVLARFVKPEALGQSVAVPVPKGLSEVSFTLPVERAIGGVIKPGDYLGIIVTTSLPEGAEKLPVTKSVIHRLLVTRVALGNSYQPPAKDGEEPPRPVVSSLMLTVAVTIPQAEQIVYLAEHSKPELGAGGVMLWAVLESKDSNTDGSTFRTPENVFQ